VLCCDKRPGAELGLAVSGIAMFSEIEELLGEEAAVRRKGALVVHGDPASWALEEERLAALQAGGVECSLLSADEVRSLEPALSGPMLGASWFPDDLQCAPRVIARGLAREALALGTVVETGVEVLSIDGAKGIATRDGRRSAANVVLAAGAWSAPLAASAGLHLPVEPRKGQLVRLERRPEFLRHKVIDGSYMAVVESEDAGLQVSTVMETTLDGHVLVGSSRERRGFDVDVDRAVSDALLTAAVRFAPGITDLAIDTAWAGLRPWLPGGLPAIGPTTVADGLFIATGHEGAGVAHGPITGRLIAQAMCGEEPELDLKPFDPDRFTPG
jgi:glycine/D-amino acid oxidase-like deaminating enzyme